MAGTYQSGVSSITGTVNATFSPTTETISVVSGIRSGAGTATLGTVGANKVWKIIGFCINQSWNGTSDQVTLNFNGVTYWIDNVRTSASSNNCASTTFRFDSYAAPTIAAGQTITLVVGGSGTGITASAAVYYVESAV